MIQPTSSPTELPKQSIPNFKTDNMIPSYRQEIRTRNSGEATCPQPHTTLIITNTQAPMLVTRDSKLTHSSAHQTINESVTYVNDADTTRSYHPPCWFMSLVNIWLKSLGMPVWILRGELISNAESSKHERTILFRNCIKPSSLVTKGPPGQQCSLWQRSLEQLMD